LTLPQVGQSSAPETASTFPLGRLVAVGYQRPWVMTGPADHVAVAELKSVELVIPTYVDECPPTTRTRPSGSTSCMAVMQSVSGTWGKRSRRTLERHGRISSAPPESARRMSHMALARHIEHSAS